MVEVIEPGVRCDRPREVPAPGVPVLEVTGLCKHFPVRKGLLRRTVGHVYAVDGVSFTIGAGRDAGAGRRVAAAARPRWGAPSCA